MSILIGIGFALILAVVLTVPWVNTLEEDIGDYDYCIGCQRCDCNDEPKSSGCGKWSGE